MSTNLYGIILWQMETYLVNEKWEIHMIHRPWLSRRWSMVPCKLLGITSAFANSIAFVGTDLLKQPFGSGSCSSCSSVADSGFTGTCLKYCKIDVTTHRLYYRCVKIWMVKIWRYFGRLLILPNFRSTNTFPSIQYIRSFPVSYFGTRYCYRGRVWP